jgi:hypothetical protein
LNIEMRVPPGIQPNFKISFRADLFDGSGLAVSNPLVPVRRGELHTVTGGEVPFRLSVNTYAVQPMRVVGELFKLSTQDLGNRRSMLLSYRPIN